jgi:hypothetical protein
MILYVQIYVLSMTHTIIMGETQYLDHKKSWETRGGQKIIKKKKNIKIDKLYNGLYY